MGACYPDWKAKSSYAMVWLFLFLSSHDSTVADDLTPRLGLEPNSSVETLTVFCFSPKILGETWKIITYKNVCSSSSAVYALLWACSCSIRFRNFRSSPRLASHIEFCTNICRFSAGKQTSFEVLSGHPSNPAQRQSLKGKRMRWWLCRNRANQCLIYTRCS